MKIERWDKLTMAIDDLRGIAKETGIIDITEIEIEVGFGSWDGEGLYGVLYTSVGDQPSEVIDAEYERLNAKWDELYPEDQIIIERDERAFVSTGTMPLSAGEEPSPLSGVVAPPGFVTIDWPPHAH